MTDLVARGIFKRERRGVKYVYALSRINVVGPDGAMQALQAAIRDCPADSGDLEALSAYLRQYPWKRVGLDDVEVFRVVAQEVRRRTATKFRIRSWTAAVKALLLLGDIQRSE